MWRSVLSSSYRLAANRSSIVWSVLGVHPRTPNLCRPSPSSSSSSSLWSEASCPAPSTHTNPLRPRFREVRDGGPAAEVRGGGPASSNAESLMMSMVKVEARSKWNKVERSELEVQEASEILEPRQGEGSLIRRQIGDNLSRRDKCKFLLDMFSELKDSKEAVYGALDAWVAWESDFPVASLRRALTMLEKDEQWHRIIQVIKWMLSKGQGNTRGTYEQLIRALEKDHRAEEAHSIWARKFSNDMHSAPWTVCELMISIYYRNNMLERLIKLFKNVEAFGRKPPKKSIVRKVADAYEVQGLLDEKLKVMEKYSYLFKEPTRKVSSKRHEKPVKSTRDDKTSPVSREDTNVSLEGQQTMH